MGQQQNYRISQETDNLQRLLFKTESVELWRRNYFIASLGRLLIGSVGGLVILIIISAH